MTVFKGNKRRITRINFFSDAQSLWLWLGFSSLGFSQSHQRKGCSQMTSIKLVAPLLDRALIIDVNVHARDQRLMGRYHNTTLDTILNINLHITNQGARRPEYI